MNKHDDRLGKSLANLFVATRDHADVLFDLKLVEPEKVRLTIQARDEKAKELVDAGLSQRQAAKALGVDEGTIRKRLRKSSAKSAEKRRTPTPAAPTPATSTVDDAKSAEKTEKDERKQLRWAATLNLISAVDTLDLLALAAYARQAKNFEMEIWLCEIRLRAERRAGEIRSAMEKATGAEYGGRAKIDGARAEVSNRHPTLDDLGITPKQSAQWQKLAAVPQQVFEAALAYEPQNRADLPSAASIIRSLEPSSRALGEILVDECAGPFSSRTIFAPRYWRVRFGPA
jgi:transposase